MIDDMGIFRTTVGVAHAAWPGERRDLADVTVDTGSEYNWIPGSVLDELGVQPVRTDRFETADGRVLERAVGFALVSAGGRTMASVVVFGEPGDMVVLGAIGLESLNLRIDLGRKELVPAGPVPAAAAHRAMHIASPLRALRTATVAFLTLVGASACVQQPVLDTSAPASLAITDPTRQVAESPRGMVASASKLATEVGATVLAEGGNAVDAAAATAFALAVTEPSMSGLGGRTSIVIRTADGQYYGIDGLNQVPRSFRAGAPPGYSNAAIPGVPAALISAVEKYGSWPLSRIMAPAIRLAEGGFPLTELEASRFAGNAEELRTFEGSRRSFLKADGSAYAPGERFIQSDLARTLRGIAEGGARAFYTGWIADSIHADMLRHGGFITRDELAGYEALPAILVRGTYRNHDLVSNYDPASGHVVIEALHIMEHFDLARMPGAEYASVVGQAMRLAMSDRSRDFGSREQSAERLTSKAYAAERAKEVAVPGPASRVPATVPPDGGDDEPWWLGPDEDNTTHLSVVDANRMAVALTQSLGPVLGTRLASPGLGFLYATRLGSEPGSRPGSTISPTIVTDPSDRLLYVLGGAGDDRIISAVIQTLSRAIDQQLPLDKAVAAPRVHPMGATTLRIERDLRSRITWSDVEMERLKALGFTIETSPSGFYGRVHAVVVDHETGRLIGVAEPRGLGGAAGPVR
jgi:gamma-glutamyltranspeptidase/glutathione hydrolase